MRIFATGWFTRFAKSERIGDDRLCEAIDRARRGLIDADLGRGLIKQRVGRPGQGRRGGFRVLIAYRTGVRAAFLYGFAKSERDNVGAASDDLIESDVADGHLRELEHGNEEEA